MTAAAPWIAPRRPSLWGWVATGMERLLSVSSHGEALPGDSMDDAQDVAAAVGGDGDAFGRLVARHQGAIAQQMRRFSRNADVVEELVHDVFVDAYLSLGSFRGRAPLLHWLRKIAVRTGLRYWKRRARDRGHAASLSSIKGYAEFVVAHWDADESQASRLLGDLLERLAPRDRLVLTLLYWDRRSVAEAAELTGWSRAMVKVQAHRARKRLKKLIEESRQ